MLCGSGWMNELNRQSPVCVKKDLRSAGPEASDRGTRHFYSTGTGGTNIRYAAPAGHHRNPAVQPPVRPVRCLLVSVCVSWEHHAQPYGGTHAEARAFGVSS